MAVLKARDAWKMDAKERKERLKELRFELVKSNVTANKSRAKTKEIKRAIARLLTINQASKSSEGAKKGRLNDK